MSSSNQLVLKRDTGRTHPFQAASQRYPSLGAARPDSSQPPSPVSLFDQLSLDQDMFQGGQSAKIMAIDALCSVWAKKTGVTLTAAGGDEEVKARRRLFSPRDDPRDTILHPEEYIEAYNRTTVASKFKDTISQLQKVATDHGLDADQTENDFLKIMKGWERIKNVTLDLGREGEQLTALLQKAATDLGFGEDSVGLFVDCVNEYHIPGAQAVKLAEESTALGLDGETFKEPFSSQLREKIADNLGCESLNTQAGVLKQIQHGLDSVYEQAELAKTAQAMEDARHKRLDQLRSVRADQMKQDSETYGHSLTVPVIETPDSTAFVGSGSKTGRSSLQLQKESRAVRNR